MGVWNVTAIAERAAQAADDEDGIGDKGISVAYGLW